MLQSYLSDSEMIILQRDPNSRLVDAALATSAAPWFLPARRFDDEFHIDGGVVFNNPAHLALIEAEQIWDRSGVGLFLSLGLGDNSSAVFSDKLRGRAEFIKDALLVGAAETLKTHSAVQHYFTSHQREDQYFRFSPPIGHLPLDVSQNTDFAEIRTRTQDYVSSVRQSDEWNRLVQYIKEKCQQ